MQPETFSSLFLKLLFMCSILPAKQLMDKYDELCEFAMDYVPVSARDGMLAYAFKQFYFNNPIIQANDLKSALEKLINNFNLQSSYDQE